MPLHHRHPLVRRETTNHPAVARTGGQCGRHVIGDEVDESDIPARIDTEQAGSVLGEPGGVGEGGTRVAAIAVQLHSGRVAQPQHGVQPFALEAWCVRV